MQTLADNYMSCFLGWGLEFLN